MLKKKDRARLIMGSRTVKIMAWSKLMRVRQKEENK